MDDHQQEFEDEVQELFEERSNETSAELLSFCLGHPNWLFDECAVLAAVAETFLVAVAAHNNISLQRLNATQHLRKKYRKRLADLGRDFIEELVTCDQTEAS